jgi:hypothetical protein
LIEDYVVLVVIVDDDDGLQAGVSVLDIDRIPWSQ